MQIPLVVFLLLYLMLVTLFVLFSSFLVYHALRFGTASFLNLFTLALYLLGAFLLLANSYSYLAGIDWASVIKLF